jgi:predicted Zn-dependent protease
MIRFSDTNEREGGSAQWKLSEYLSSHPLTKNRILRMQELDKEFYASDSHQTD